MENTQKVGYNRRMTKRAIIHVENAENILEFAEFLVSSGWTILSANRTEDVLKKHKIPVVREPALVENTLYMNDTSQLVRRILLSRYDEEEDSYTQYTQEENNIYLVCMNVNPVVTTDFPFNQIKTVTKPINYYVSTIIRNSFANYENVLILTDPADYKEAMIQIRTDDISDKFRTYLAGKALNMVSAIDSGIAASILENKTIGVDFMNYLTFPFQKSNVLHNDSNDQMPACLYKNPSDAGSLNSFMKIQGKELTYGIISDVSFAWEQINKLYNNLKTQYSVQSINCDGYEFSTQFTPLVGTIFTIAVKNHCIVGASLATNVIDSFKKTYSYDSEVIKNVTFGCSAVIDEIAANEIVKCNFSAVIAPGFTQEAKDIFAVNKNIRLIPTTKTDCIEWDGQLVNGGLLLQVKDNTPFTKWFVRTKNRPSQSVTDEMAFGTLLTMGARSYSALLLYDNTIIGISQACTSVKKALFILLHEAKDYAKRINGESSEDEKKTGLVLVTDSEISFCDEVKELIDYGVTAIIQTGGTPTDDEFITYCNEKGVVMVFTGISHISF